MNNLLISSFKILLSTIVGAIIGFDRERRGKPAGIKTHSLVCLGATMITIIGLLTFKDTNIGDPMRLSAQVVSGLGFLGAGVILNRDNHIEGLTTAASVWFAGCIGICLGSDYFHLVFPAVICYFVVIKLMAYLEKKYIKKKEK
ncbi:MAG: MgtC/SapB family protein [Erysipelotrichaceae bacterium]|nr:MgtC/SapB family protein [Erysipelotrichaceae bacterium]